MKNNRLLFAVNVFVLGFQSAFLIVGLHQGLWAVVIAACFFMPFCAMGACAYYAADRRESP